MKLSEIRDAQGKLPTYSWPDGYPMFYVVDDVEHKGLYNTK